MAGWSQIVQLYDFIVSVKTHFTCSSTQANRFTENYKPRCSGNNCQKTVAYESLLLSIDACTSTSSEVLING